MKNCLKRETHKEEKGTASMQISTCKWNLMNSIKLESFVNLNVYIVSQDSSIHNKDSCWNNVIHWSPTYLLHTQAPQLFQLQAVHTAYVY